MDTPIETVERNIGNLYNYINYMAHMLTKFMHEFKQRSNVAPPGNQEIGVDTTIPTIINDITKVTETSSVSGHQK